MTNRNQHGTYVHGEFRGTSSTGGNLTVYDQEGTAVTATTAERFEIWSCWANSTATGDLIFWVDADNGNDADAGEVVYRYQNPANGGFSHSFGDNPWLSQEGTGLEVRVSGASGTINAGFVGRLVEI